MSQLSLTYPGTVGFNGRENTKNILREHSVFHINSFHANMYVAIAIGTVSFCKTHRGGNIVCKEVTILYYSPVKFSFALRVRK